MHSQNWRNRDDRYPNQNFDRDNRGDASREPARWDRDQEMESRWAERNLDDVNGMRRGAEEWRPADRYTDRHTDRGANSPSRYEDYSMRSSRGYDNATVRGGYGYGSDLQNGRTRDYGDHATMDRLGPSFDSRGHQQGRYVPSGRYDERGYVSGDESSLKYSDRNYSPGNSSIYDRGTEMPGGRFQGKGPKGYTRSDERIREEVCECLSSGHIDASDIDVVVQDGEVTLSGTVMDRRTRRQAEEMLDNISGVKDVENKLRVKMQGGEDFGQKEKPPQETKKSETKRATA